MVEIGQNFTIVEGVVYKDGVPVVGSNGIWKPREDGEKKVTRLPLMRWKDNSFLTEQQWTDEDYQIDLKIA
ncbi:MAG: hypothetical protein NTY75_03640 [Candidatus Shapirobacteria bacterium]|nr:hypothetical protein [Candidatus Shapirobacteria bacterium]